MNIIKTDSTSRSGGRAGTCQCVVNSMKKCINVCCGAIYALMQQLQAQSACQKRAQDYTWRLWFASKLTKISHRCSFLHLPSMHCATSYQVSIFKNKEVGKKIKFRVPLNHVTQVKRFLVESTFLQPDNFVTKATVQMRQSCKTRRKKQLYHVKTRRHSRGKDRNAKVRTVVAVRMQVLLLRWLTSVWSFFSVSCRFSWLPPSRAHTFLSLFFLFSALQQLWPHV